VLSPSGFSGIYSRLQTVDPSQKNRRKITVLRFQELYTFFYIFFPVFRKYMVQKFPVIAKVKRFFYFMQVAEEISDNKPAPDSPFLCIFSSDLYCCRRTIDTDYVKSLTCQVYSKLPAPQPRSMVLQGHTFHFESAQQENPGVSRYSMEFYQAYFLVKHKKRKLLMKNLSQGSVSLQAGGISA
jgi:hypothetical protein